MKGETLSGGQLKDRIGDYICTAPPGRRVKRALGALRVKHDEDQ